jgi:glycosyltransferase involved in cell wall biosynthesis
MNIVHLTASTFYGGPERQMLGLARSLPADRWTFLSFSEKGRGQQFVTAARELGFEAAILEHDTPRLKSAIKDIERQLVRVGASVLLCHGYKACILGRIAARRLGVPVIGVSRGWTAESLRVRMYEFLDRINLRWMDRVICVSDAQAQKVQMAGVPVNKVMVIRNAIAIDRFRAPDGRQRRQIERMFPSCPSHLVGAAGRLSGEKGFGVLVEAAALVCRHSPAAGFVVFGDGPLRETLQDRIDRAGLRNRLILGGFRPDLDELIPSFDIVAIPSFTEGLSNVALEASAAAVPVVGTAVGGNPEVIEDGRTGYLVPPGDAKALADRVLDVLASRERALQMGRCARRLVSERFTFVGQSQQYQRLFQELLGSSSDGMQAELETACT